MIDAIHSVDMQGGPFVLKWKGQQLMIVFMID